MTERGELQQPACRYAERMKAGARATCSSPTKVPDAQGKSLFLLDPQHWLASSIMSGNEVDPLLECIAYPSEDMRSSDDTAALLGSLVPISLAVVLLSTPRLRAQWSFRILVFALVVLILQSVIKLHVRLRNLVCPRSARNSDTHP